MKTKPKFSAHKRPPSPPPRKSQIKYVPTTQLSSLTVADVQRNWVTIGSAAAAQSQRTAVKVVASV